MVSAPKVITYPDTEWEEKTGKPSNVIAYTRGDDDGVPDGDDLIVMRTEHFQDILLNGRRANRKALFSVVHELGHNYDKDRDGFDPAWDHPSVTKDGYWACVKDAILVKRFGTMCAIYQLQWFKHPKSLWSAFDGYLATWRKQRGM